MRLNPTDRTTSRKTGAGLGIVVIALTVIAAACSSSSKPSLSAGQPSTATVISRSTGAGTIVADATGRPLYTFANDPTGATTSACTGSCASAWPPLTASGTPTAGAGVTGTLAKLPSGQVTWNGHPLYTFASDSPGGSPTGDGVSGFHLASASGSPAATATTSAGYHY